MTKTEQPTNQPTHQINKQKNDQESFYEKILIPMCFSLDRGIYNLQ